MWPMHCKQQRISGETVCICVGVGVRERVIMRSRKVVFSFKLIYYLLKGLWNAPCLAAFCLLAYFVIQSMKAAKPRFAWLWSGYKLCNSRLTVEKLVVVPDCWVQRRLLSWWSFSTGISCFSKAWCFGVTWDQTWDHLDNPPLKSGTSVRRKTIFSVKWGM